MFVVFQSGSRSPIISVRYEQYFEITFKKIYSYWGFILHKDNYNDWYHFREMVKNRKTQLLFEKKGPPA